MGLSDVGRLGSAGYAVGLQEGYIDCLQNRKSGGICARTQENAQHKEKQARPIYLEQKRQEAGIERHVLREVSMLVQEHFERVGIERLAVPDGSHEASSPCLAMAFKTRQ